MVGEENISCPLISTHTYTQNKQNRDSGIDTRIQAYENRKLSIILSQGHMSTGTTKSKLHSIDQLDDKPQHSEALAKALQRIQSYR